MVTVIILNSFHCDNRKSVMRYPELDPLDDLDEMSNSLFDSWASTGQFKITL